MSFLHQVNWKTKYTIPHFTTALHCNFTLQYSTALHCNCTLHFTWALHCNFTLHNSTALHCNRTIHFIWALHCDFTLHFTTALHYKWRPCTVCTQAVIGIAERRQSVIWSPLLEGTKLPLPSGRRIIVG